MDFIDLNTYIHKEGRNLKKKIMQLLWTVVTYLLKNVGYGIERVLIVYCLRSLHTLDIRELYSRFDEYALQF